MNALNLLEIYNSSESENDEESSNNGNQIERLPVPAAFSKNFLPVLQEINKDGKIRNFPHEPGIWATYISLPLAPSSELLEYIDNLKHFLSGFSLNLVDDFHISLTKTVILKHHWIQDFTSAVKQKLNFVKSFKVHIGSLKVYTNEFNTRTFLSLEANDELGTLYDLVEKLNCCLKEYNLDTFYSDPSFHLSILWCSGKKETEINDVLQKLPPKLRDFSFDVNVTYCLCISGNKFFRFSFH